ETPVATMGSCFVVAIRQWLISNGFNYVSAETGPGTKQGSARFGRLFNTGVLRQIFEHSHGRFNPVEKFWPHDGLLLDPYRQGIAWPNPQSAEIERKIHGEAVARMTRDAEVLICTVGISETWRSRDDGSVFHTVPPASAFDPAKHEFSLLGVEENLANLEATYNLVREHNPDIQLILTLSPVPLGMTFRDMSVVCADMVSKSMLRVAIDMFIEQHPEVVYFPAFELVRRMVPEPFMEDWRHVKPALVCAIMARFMTHFGSPGEVYQTPIDLAAYMQASSASSDAGAAQENGAPKAAHDSKTNAVGAA
ncbi:MAG: GSCFA domain-containing protein, partial [Planctomycetota bacterium]